MEELEELREGRQVKNSHPTDQQTLPQTPTQIPFCHSLCPSSSLHPAIWDRDLPDLTSHGGGEVLESVCFSLTQHIEF